MCSLLVQSVYPLHAKAHLYDSQDTKTHVQDTELKFTNAYPHIKTSSIGPSHYKKIPPITHKLRWPVSFDAPKAYKENNLREYATSRCG